MVPGLAGTLFPYSVVASLPDTPESSGRGRHIQTNARRVQGRVGNGEIAAASVLIYRTFALPAGIKAWHTPPGRAQPPPGRARLQCRQENCDGSGGAIKCLSQRPLRPPEVGHCPKLFTTVKKTAFTSHISARISDDRGREALNLKDDQNMDVSPLKFGPFRNTEPGETFPDVFPLGTQTVGPANLPAFLEMYREQSLWLACVVGLNADLATTARTHRWILSQPDCDNVVAVAAWRFWEGSYFCGVAAGDHKHIGDAHLIVTLIAERSRLRPFTTDALRDPPHNRYTSSRAQLLAQAEEAVLSLGPDVEPLVAIPVALLGHQPLGPLPMEGYVVDETGLAVIPLTRH